MNISYNNENDTQTTQSYMTSTYNQVIKCVLYIYIIFCKILNKNDYIIIYRLLSFLFKVFLNKQKTLKNKKHAHIIKNLK